jgi:hypothetical protein
MIPEGWEICGPVDVSTDPGGGLVLSAIDPPGDGSERGIVTAVPHRDRELSFDVFIPSGSAFIAKINQAAKADQRTNSYHVYCEGGGAYLARHYSIFKTFDLPRDRWVRLGLACQAGWLSVHGPDGVLHRCRERLLTDGFAFLGVRSGSVLLRDVRIGTPREHRAVATAMPLDGAVVCPPAPRLQPRVSIVTTVYDRVECLADCISSVQRLEHRDYEHVIVSDCPPAAVVDQIAALVRSAADPRISYLNLPSRHNNWGIAPAAVGLRQARGEYVCFLSDDNGYTPEHVGTLVQTLDRDRSLGFVYSSCRYAGRLTLRHPRPAPARIDLGQPMFRRSLFTEHLDDDLPFEMMAWDWALIDTFVQRGVRWKHVDVLSFIFRLAQYQHLRVQP